MLSRFGGINQESAKRKSRMSPQDVADARMLAGTAKYPPNRQSEI
jgi:hypothetical protein